MPSVSVIFEHPDFIIVEKPPSVTMHHADGESSILSLMYELDYQDLYLVHRLDTDTSGLLILAKNQRAAATFASMFQRHLVDKYYVALSDKKPLKKQGHICGDMKNIRNGNYALTRDMSHPAYTQFISQSITLDSNQPLRIFMLKPFTGKTHQLRVALKSVGAPIIGDRRYSKTHADRMYLHALALKFKYLGDDYQFTSIPIDGAYFASEEFQQSPMLQVKPWTIDWPAPRAGFKTIEA